MNHQLLTITNWLEQHQLPCILKKLTSFDCPGCGIQRSSIALLKGYVGESFRLYPPLFPIIFLFTMLITYLLLKWEKGYLHLKYTYIFCAAAIIVNYIFKFFSLLN
jgi:hypothetical protein